MQIRSISLSKSFYHPGEEVTFLFEIDSQQIGTAELLIQVQHLAESPQLLRFHVQLKAGSHPLEINWQPPSKPAGYAVKAGLLAADGSFLSEANLCFDVLNDWTDYPRYGYLTDFSPLRSDLRATIAELARYHVNGLQFYDWQYRHDQLLAPTRDYIDPLGRAMSLDTVERLVQAAADYGMAAMPYLAVYAASAAYWRAHLESALYDQQGQPIPFGEDFLGLMNPAEGTTWHEHLLKECDRALQAIPFSGLHIDQYGEPRQVWDAHANPVDLPGAFADFIRAARANHRNQTILFNAVSNWPIETLAACPLNFLYIEIWPPDVHYTDVALIVLEAVRLSGGRPVVIALYLPASQPENVLLVDALITACAGTRIELGETVRLLADPYFPKHQEISPELKANLLKHYDFMARFGEWLQAYTLSAGEREIWAQGELQPVYVQTDAQVWSIARRRPDGLQLNLVNLNGLDQNLSWDAAHEAPLPVENLVVRVRLAKKPARIYWACAEMAEQPPLELNFDFEDGEVTFNIPSLQLSGVIFIHE